MTKFKNRAVCAMLSAAVGIGALTGCGAEKAIDGTQTAAVMDGENISLGAANFMLRYQQASTAQYNEMLSAYFGGGASTELWDGKGKEAGTTYGDEFKDSVLNNLQKMYLLRANAEKFNVTLTDEEKENAKKAAKTFVEDNKGKAIEKIGCSEADVAEMMELYAYQNKMFQAMTADTDTEVSDEEAKQTKITYVKLSTVGTETDEDGNKIELTAEEKTTKKELAEKLLEKVLSAEKPAEADINALAKELDENLNASTTTYDSSNTGLSQKLKDAAAALKDGEIHREVIEDEDAYYILRLDAEIDREATDQKKEQIISERKQQDYNDMLDGWVKDSKITAKKVWENLKVTDSDSFTFKIEEEAGE